MAIFDFLRGAPSPGGLEIVITTGAEGVELGVEARTGPRTAYNPPLRDQVAGRLALVRGADGRLAEGGMRVEPGWQGRGVEALLRAEARKELARLRGGRATLRNGGPGGGAPG